jgi:hypothetical protein
VLDAPTDGAKSRQVGKRNMQAHAPPMMAEVGITSTGLYYPWLKGGRLKDYIHGGGHYY